MEYRTKIERFLDKKRYGEFSVCLNTFKTSEYLWPFSYNLIQYKRLKSQYYKSHIHGATHTERVLLFAALLAQKEALTPLGTKLLLKSALFHNIGRSGDWDGPKHGDKSAQKLAGLEAWETPWELAVVQGVVAAHSYEDVDMDSILTRFGVCDVGTRRLAALLKDADALDRVRGVGLAIDCLRTDSAKSLVGLAVYVNEYYAPVPELVKMSLDEQMQVASERMEQRETNITSLGFVVRTSMIWRICDGQQFWFGKGS